MKYKKIMLILITAIFLASIAGVCAADANDTIVTSEDNLEIDKTTDDTIGVGEDTDFASSEENEILTGGEQTFANLNTTINGNADKDIYLNGNYKYSSGDDSFKNGIIIDRDVNIYGNGHTINGSCEARIFTINSGKVVFYNIIFVNGNAIGDGESGGAINGNCRAIDCTFKENYADYGGGAMYGGSAVNCTFSGNSAERDGGAMWGGSAVNCIFSGNSAGDGGAMWGGSAVNCTFTGNSAERDGGAMRGGSAVNCIFTGNRAWCWGGAMFEGSAVNCTFTGNTADSNSGAMYAVGYQDCYGQKDEYKSCKELSLFFDVKDFTSTYNSNKEFIISLKSQKEKVIFINVDVVIFKDDVVVRSYSSLSGDSLIFDLAASNYTALLNVTYPGLTADSKKINLTINKATPKIEVQAHNTTYPGNVVVYVKSDVSGEYAVSVGGVSQNVNLTANEVKNITFTALPANENGHIINVTHNSENYTGFNDTVKVIVYKATPKIEVQTHNTTYPGNVVVYVKSNVGGFYVVKIGDRSQILTLNAGIEENITFTGLPANEDGYTVKVTYAATENYTNSINDTVKVIVHKATPKIEVSAIDVTYPSDVVVTVKSDVDGTCVVKVGDKNETGVLVAGVATDVNLGVFNVDTYMIIVEYVENANYTSVTRNATITVNKAKTELAADAIITTYSVSKDLMITLKDSNGNPIGGLNITVDFNGTKNYTTDTSGQVKISTKGLAANIYDVMISFNGTDNYLNSSNTTTVSIYKESSRVDTKPLTTDYNMHKYLVVGLKDNEGNPIRNADAFIEIHGVTYKCRSDDSGDARLIIRLNPGTYTAKITFDNVNYTGFTQYVTVIVKKLTPKLTAKKKTFRKAKKVKKYTVTLKANSKALAKVKLTLKVKGKTYKAKTNAKGKAVFKIKNLKKKGKYTAKVTFKGNKYYKKASKKVKITIK